MQNAEVAPRGVIDTSKVRLPTMTSLRWIAALLVFAYHATGPYMFPNGVFTNAVPFALRTSGTSALSFFFVLSGFVMTWSTRPGQSARSFYQRRAAKLYPNHVLTWFIMLVLLDWTPLWPLRHGATGVFQSLFLVQAWSPDPYVTIGVNAVSWSLSADAFCVLLFPFWVKLINKIRPERLWSWVGGCCLVMVCVPFIALLLPYRPMLPVQLVGVPTSAWQYWFVFFCPATIVFEFLLGSLVARLVINRRWLNVNVPTAMVVLLGCYAISIVLPVNFYGVVAISAIPIALLMGAVARADLGGRAGFLKHPVMLWLGNLSFSFYLLHLIVLDTVVTGLMVTYHWTTLSAVGMIFALLLVTLGLAWVMYNLVEKPMLRLLSPKSWYGARRSSTTALSGGWSPDGREESPADPEPVGASRSSAA